jgi:hypothetical protein
MTSTHVGTGSGTRRPVPDRAVARLAAQLKRVRVEKPAAETGPPIL